MRRLSDGIPAPVPPDPNNIAALSSGNPFVWDYSLNATQTKLSPPCVLSPDIARALPPGAEVDGVAGGEGRPGACSGDR